MSETQHALYAQKELRRTYQEALESFVAKVKQDRYIVAAILFGSLAYDDVWEKSDIDIVLIGKDGKATARPYSLVEHGINIHVFLEPRNNFKASIERTLQGSFMHSVLTRSTLLFSTDETIEAYYANVRHVGHRDRELQLLNQAAYILPTLTKAEKWLFVKQDPAYSFLWIMYLMDHLARVEVLLHSDVAGREVIRQALTYNPAFFTPLYIEFVNQPKDEATVRRAISMINDYLDKKVDILFKPVLSYLADAGGARSTTEINEHLKKRIQSDGLELFSATYEWLAGKGIIQKVSSPLRLTEKSQVTVDEAAYYYDGGAIHATDTDY
jgi:predicted nucleotidyltransferase